MVSWFLVTKKCYVLSKLTRIVIVMLVCHLAGCAAGSCISYGHSCWGAHGKRNGDLHNPIVKPILEDRAYQRPPNIYEMLFSRLENRKDNENSLSPRQVHSFEHKDKNRKLNDFIRTRDKDDRSLKLLLTQL